MSLKDLMAEDAANVVLNSDEFAEEIQYTPHNGTVRTIKAIVERSRIMPDSADAGRVLAKTVEVNIARHATLGVLAVTKNGDKISLPTVIGGTNDDYVVVDILSQDEGLWRLLLKR